MRALPSLLLAELSGGNARLAGPGVTGQEQVGKLRTGREGVLQGGKAPLAGLCSSIPHPFPHLCHYCSKHSYPLAFFL